MEEQKELVIRGKRYLPTKQVRHQDKVFFEYWSADTNHAEVLYFEKETFRQVTDERMLDELIKKFCITPELEPSENDRKNHVLFEKVKLEFEKENKKVSETKDDKVRVPAFHKLRNKFITALVAAGLTLSVATMTIQSWTQIDNKTKIEYAQTDFSSELEKIKNHYILALQELSKIPDENEKKVAAFSLENKVFIDLFYKHKMDADKAIEMMNAWENSGINLKTKDKIIYKADKVKESIKNIGLEFKEKKQQKRIEKKYISEVRKEAAEESQNVFVSDARHFSKNTSESSIGEILKKHGIEDPQQWLERKMNATWAGNSVSTYLTTNNRNARGSFNYLDGGNIRLNPVYSSFSMETSTATRAHEMAHKITNNAFNTGFQRIQRVSEKGIQRLYRVERGRGFNEGATELLTEKLLGDKKRLQIGYLKEMFFARQICDLVGEDVFFGDMFFETGGVQRQIDKMGGQDTYFKLINALDEHYRIHRIKDKNISFQEKQERKKDNLIEAQQNIADILCKPIFEAKTEQESQNAKKKLLDFYNRHNGFTKNLFAPNENVFDKVMTDALYNFEILEKPKTKGQ